MVMSPWRTGRTVAPTAWRVSASARASVSSVPLRITISPRMRASPAAWRIGGGAAATLSGGAWSDGAARAVGILGRGVAAAGAAVAGGPTLAVGRGPGGALGGGQEQKWGAGALARAG